MFEERLAGLLEWIEQHDYSGKYLDGANHPIWGIVNENELPHTFQYYGIIISYLNLYRNLKNENYLKKAVVAGNFLCSLQRWNGQFRFDAFEFNTGYITGLALIHNSLPAIALLELYKVTKNRKYLKVAKKSIIWQFSRLWNGNYLTGCINQDMCAAEALALLYSIEKQQIYLDRAKKLADFCLKYQIPEGELKGGFIRGTKETDLVIPWYDAKTAVSYFKIYEISGDKRYLESAKLTAEFLRKNLTKNGLVHWYIKKDSWEKVEKPYLIAPAGLVFYLFYKLGIKSNPKMLEMQLPNGAFPCAQEYEDKRDLPNLGWNQFMLLYLSEIAEKNLPRAEIGNYNPVFRKDFQKTVEGRVFGLTKNGYIDILKDKIAIYSERIINGKIAAPYLEGSTMRIRMENSLWLCRKSENRKDLKIHVSPYNMKLPYIIMENIFTEILKKLFASRIFDKIAGIRMLKNDR